MDHSKELIENGKSSAENLALKNLEKRCKDECRKLGIDLFYKENGQREIEYNLDSVYTYLSKLSFQNIGSYGVSIVAFQIYFEANNIDIGKIDGIEGPKFISGIKEYQIQNNLPQTGRLDTKTVATIKNDIKEKQKTMICSNEKPTNMITEPETIKWEHQLTAIKLNDNQYFGEGLKTLCDWCTNNYGDYALRLNLNQKYGSSNQMDVYVNNITKMEANNYQITFINSTGQEYTDNLSNLETCIAGFDIWSKNKALPELKNFIPNVDTYDHTKPFYYNEDIS